MEPVSHLAEKRHVEVWPLKRKVKLYHVWNKAPLFGLSKKILPVVSRGRA